MMITNFWDARHLRCNAVLELSASPQDRGEKLQAFIREKFGCRVFPVQTELRTMLLGLTGDTPALDMIDSYSLLFGLLKTSSCWATVPDTHVFVMTQTAPVFPVPFDEKLAGDLAGLMTHMNNISAWDIHTATIREYHAQIRSGRTLLPVGLLVFTKEAWEQSKRGRDRKPFDLKNCSDAAKPLCSHLSKLLTDRSYEVIEITNDIGLVKMGGERKNNCGTRMIRTILSWDAGVCFLPEEFDPVLSESGEVIDWKLRPGCGLFIEENSQDNWTIRACHITDKAFEARSGQGSIASREEALERAARLWPDVPVLGDARKRDEMIAERLAKFSTGSSELDQLLGTGEWKPAGANGAAGAAGGKPD